MITVKVNPSQINRIAAELKDKSKRLPREIATAINQTSKKVRSVAAKALKKELNVPARVLKKAIRTKQAKKDNLVAVVGLFAGYPIPLKYFKPRQIKGGKRGGGVTFKIDPKYSARSVIRGAFIMQPSGHVAERVGKDRYPIRFAHGPAPGSAFEKAGIRVLAEKTAAQELPKQMERRIRFLKLQTAGGLRGSGTRKGRGNQ